MIRWDWGDFRLTLLDAGTVWLDGGAMFGIVPKPVWEREREPDERNRIRLAMNVLLIEDGHERTLVDTGAGDDWDAKSRSIYGLETKTAAALLEPAGLRPEQIDRVVCTHLHFDHAGGNTTRADGGKPTPSFPEAEYVAQRGELETARWANERTRASFVPDSFEPLAAEPGRLRLVEGDHGLAPGLFLSVAPGHTPWMQTVRIEGGPSTLCFLADLVPTTSHVRYPYIMGYDLEPLRTLASKKALLPQACREGWKLVFQHDPSTPLATLTERGGRLKAQAWRPGD